MADLFMQRITPPVAPNGRKEPRLWVRRLVLFENRQTVIRDIHLEPGLNIIWSPDMTSQKQQALAHGSGKTTFCRLLRACLGEEGIANDEQRRRLMDQLPDGFAAAEIIIDGDCWVAFRSFGLGENYATKADSIEEALERRRQENDPDSIDPIITEAFFQRLLGCSPKEVGDEKIWDVFRAWLSRDQECRLTDILAWRSPKTQSHSCAQQLSEESKLTMVRLALRALDPEEQQAARREKELRKAEEEERKRQVEIETIRRYRISEIRKALGVGDHVSLEDTIDQKGLISLAEENLKMAIRAIVPKVPDIKLLYNQLDALHKRLSKLLEEKQASEYEAEKKRTEAQHLRSEAELGETDISQGRIRVCPICRVAISEVLARGCKISLELCDVEKIKGDIRIKRETASKLEQDARTLDETARQLAAEIEQLDQQIKVEEEKLKKAIAAQQEALKAASRIQDEVYRARRILDNARSLLAMEKDEAGSNVAKELEAVRAQLEKGRKRAQESIQILQERYSRILTAWLPEGIDGTVKLDGKGLHVSAELSGRGEISTAALDSLKILAFDLAILHLATEEKVDLPAFLIHDSPREADLDGALYARLFKLIHEWETRTEAPCFQYIVTTTSSPPEELQTDDFIRLRISSTPAERRLFKRDL